MVCCEDPLRKGAPLRPVGCPYEVTPEELHPKPIAVPGAGSRLGATSPVMAS
jgi:hypothetical protein